MDERKRKNFIIVVLCVLVIFMGVAYAILTRQLSVTGTATIPSSSNWQVSIKSISASTSSDSTVPYNEGRDCTVANPCDGNSTTVPTANTSQIELYANLKKPNDYVIYTITVQNTGAINATLDSITKFVTLGEGETSDFIKSDYTYQDNNTYGIYEGDNITVTVAGFVELSELDLPSPVSPNVSEKTFTVKFQYNDKDSLGNDPTSVATGETAMLSFDLNYIQS